MPPVGIVPPLSGPLMCLCLVSSEWDYLPRARATDFFNMVASGRGISEEPATSTTAHRRLPGSPSIADTPFETGLPRPGPAPPSGTRGRPRPRPGGPCLALGSHTNQAFLGNSARNAQGSAPAYNCADCTCLSWVYGLLYHYASSMRALILIFQRVQLAPPPPVPNVVPPHPGPHPPNFITDRRT
jgi:hypothetical protein